MSHVRLRSLAKINLDLRVLHKRSDGFHELRTIFQTVSLADTLEIEFHLARRSRIEIDSAIDIPDNLIARAADLVLSAMGVSAAVHFRLEKRIPMGGGLGGGSSNAAAVLLALPVLAARPIALEKLLEIGSQLGSDVPFFLLGGTAIGLGRGTELYPLPDIAPRHAILVCPGVRVSTGAAYEGLQRALTPDGSFRNMNSFQSFAWSVGEYRAGQDWEAVNDFETVVFGKYPQLKSIKGKLLKLGARPALMSGSGSTIFGIFDSRGQRDAASQTLLASLRGKELAGTEFHSVSLLSRRQYRSLWRRQLRSVIEGSAIQRQSKTWPPQLRFAK